MCPMKIDGPADSGGIPSGGHSRDGRNSERLNRIVVGPQESGHTGDPFIVSDPVRPWPAGDLTVEIGQGLSAG